MTAPAGYLTPLTRSQVDVLHAKMAAVRAVLHEVLSGDSPVRYGSDAYRSFLDLQDEISDVAGDAAAEMEPAQEREIGAEDVARAKRNVRLGDIAKAEQLLAAERTAGAR